MWWYSGMSIVLPISVGRRAEYAVASICTSRSRLLAHWLTAASAMSYGSDPESGVNHTGIANPGSTPASAINALAASGSKGTSHSAFHCGSFEVYPVNV